MEYLPEYTLFFTALLVILDPFAAIPIFLNLPQNYSHQELTHAVTLSSITVAIVSGVMYLSAI